MQETLVNTFFKKCVVKIVIRFQANPLSSLAHILDVILPTLFY